METEVKLPFMVVWNWREMKHETWKRKWEKWERRRVNEAFGEQMEVTRMGLAGDIEDLNRVE